MPDNPIISLHDDVIATFARQLRQELVARGETCAKLADLQKSFMKSLCKALPAVIPLFEKDKARRNSLKTGLGRPMCDGNTNGQTELWIDGVIKLREEQVTPTILDDTLD
jgi:hypothetical protein